MNVKDAFPSGTFTYVFHTFYKSHCGVGAVRLCEVGKRLLIN